MGMIFPIIRPSAEPEQDTGTHLKFTDYDLSRMGNVLTFGPVAREYSEIETLLLAVVLAKMTKTPDGLKHLRDIFIKYLDSTARIIESMQRASSANWMNALLNSYVAVPIYERLGLITPFDKVHTQLWLDHVFGEMEKISVAFEGLTSITTLIEGSKVSAGKGGVSGESLGTLATLLKVLK
jgi:hypothetical protein